MKQARQWRWLVFLAVIMTTALPPAWGAPPAASDTSTPAVSSGYLENVTFEKLPGKERVTLTVSKPSGVTVENQPGNALLVRLENLFVPEGLRRPLDDASLANVIRVTPVQKAEGGRSWVFATIELRQKVPYSVRQEGLNVIVDFNVTSLATAVDSALKKPLPPEQQTSPAQPPAAQSPAALQVSSPAETPVTPAKTAPKETAGGDGKGKKVYTGARISLDVQDADIKSVFRLLAELGNVSIVSGADVKGTVTLKIHDALWEETLDTILAIHGLYKVENNNVIMVMGQDSFSKLKKAEADLARRNQMELDREPLITRIVPIKYRMLKYAAASAKEEKKVDFKKDILLGNTSGETTVGADTPPGSRPADGSAPVSGANLQQTRLFAASGAPDGAAAAKAGEEKKVEDTYFIQFLQNYLSRDAEGKRRGWIAADADTNSVIITAIKRDMDIIMDMIAKTDIPTDQVLIKANIVETTKTMARTVGIQWGGVLGRNLGSQNMYLTPGGTGTATGATPPGGVLSGGYVPKYGTSAGIGGQGYGVNLPASVIGGTVPGSLGLIFGTIGGNMLELQLSALQTEGKLIILSSPSLVTLDNQTASTENGDEVPYITPPTRDSPATVIWKKVVLRLEITPHVIDRKNIKMTIVVKKDELNTTNCVDVGGYPQCSIFVKETKTDLVVADGETIVISGLTKQTKTGGTAGVPWFKEIPVLGWLFKGDNKTEAMEEVLIFITPSVIMSQEITEIQTGS